MSKLFFTSSIIKKEENKMAKKEKIEKENLSEIMNLIRAEEVMCYDKETGKCILLENLEAISQQEKVKYGFSRMIWSCAPRRRDYDGL